MSFHFFRGNFFPGVVPTVVYERKQVRDFLVGKSPLRHYAIKFLAIHNQLPLPSARHGLNGANFVSVQEIGFCKRRKRSSYACLLYTSDAADE